MQHMVCNSACLLCKPPGTTRHLLYTAADAGGTQQLHYHKQYQKEIGKGNNEHRSGRPTQARQHRTLTQRVYLCDKFVTDHKLIYDCPTNTTPEVDGVKVCYDGKPMHIKRVACTYKRMLQSPSQPAFAATHSHRRVKAAIGGSQ